jgi:hypothetical protein
VYRTTPSQGDLIISEIQYYNGGGGPAAAVGHAFEWLDLLFIWEKSMNIGIKKFRTPSACLAIAALVISVASARAADVKVKLSGAEETPPVTTSASGNAKFTIGADKSVTGKVDTTGIEGIAAHIHVGAPGQAGPPVITLVKGDKGEWTVPSGAMLTDEQLASFKAGNLYVNVHSAEHKPGEIRGQLKP